MSKLNTIIIGAGQIASGYDKPDSASVLTHAHAVCKHPRFNLLGFYDSDVDRARQAAEKWGGKAYNSPQSADVIVICTPDDVHCESVKQAAELSPKLIILEKPIARNLEEVEEILKITKSIPTQVNFTRRFVPEFQELAGKIKGYGSFTTGTGLYGKGFIHNGSHMVDLLQLLVGEISSADMIGEIDDFYPTDKTKTVILKLNNGEFFMRGIDSRHYSVFELDLCFERARIRIIDGGKGIKTYLPVQSKEYAGYTVLDLFEEIPVGIGDAMINLYQNVYDYLTGGELLISPIGRSLHSCRILLGGNDK